jgi:hypothetical protein
MSITNSNQFQSVFGFPPNRTALKDNVREIFKDAKLKSIGEMTFT